MEQFRFSKELRQLYQGTIAFDPLDQEAARKELEEAVIRDIDQAVEVIKEKPKDSNIFKRALDFTTQWISDFLEKNRENALGWILRNAGIEEPLDKLSEQEWKELLKLLLKEWGPFFVLGPALKAVGISLIITKVASTAGWLGFVQWSQRRAKKARQESEGEPTLEEILDVGGATA